MSTFRDWLLEPVMAELAVIKKQLNTLIQQGVKEMAVLDDLTAQVTENTQVESSAITLIQNIATQLANAGTDPAKLQALQATLKTSSDQLAAAIAANTPVAPPTP